jgi:hypothetical protein
VLTVGTEQRELAPVARKQPQEIAIAKHRVGVAGRKIGIGRPRRRRIDQVLRRDDLPASPNAVVGEEAPQPRI